MTAIPTHITIGDIRKAIAGLADDQPLHLQYNEVELDTIFLRIDDFSQGRGPGWIPAEDGDGLELDQSGRVSDMAVLTVSLLGEDTDEEDDGPAPGEHCPDESCPGVIEGDGCCSHCGTDFEELESDTSDEDDEDLDELIDAIETEEHENAQLRNLGVTIAGEDDTERVKQRLEYLRGELQAERISYDELHELQSLASHIEPDDVELLQAAGVPEFPEDEEQVGLQEQIQNELEAIDSGDFEADLLNICLGMLPDSSLATVLEECKKHRARYRNPDTEDEDEDENQLDIQYRCPRCGNNWEEQWEYACDSECDRCGQDNITALRWKGEGEEWPAPLPEQLYTPNVGDKRRLTKQQFDDDADGNERVTLPGVAVEITKLVPSQDNCFVVSCPDNGAWWFFTLEELLGETEAIPEENGDGNQDQVQGP